MDLAQVLLGREEHVTELKWPGLEPETGTGETEKEFEFKEKPEPENYTHLFGGNLRRGTQTSDGSVENGRVGLERGNFQMMTS